MAAIDGEVGTGDPAGILGGEEGDGVGDFLRPAEAADGDLRDDLRADIFGNGHDQVGAHVARRYRVHRDAEARVLLGERDGEPVHDGLGRRVVGLYVLALLACARTDLYNDPPLPRTHAFDDGAGDVEAGVEVGVHHLGPLLV